MSGARWERHQCLTRDRVGTEFTEQCADSTERTSLEEIDESGICGTVLTGCVTMRAQAKRRERERTVYIDVELDLTGSDRDALPSERLRRQPAHEVHQVPGSQKSIIVR